MEKVNILTPRQKLILQEIAKNDYLSKNFCFSGGTALSEYYLQHRLSDDLDFFTQSKINSQAILTILGKWGEKHRFTLKNRSVDEVTFIFFLKFIDGKELKIDFAEQACKKLEKEEVRDGILVDSLLDIATNKMLTVTQRTEVKDFVDLFFLLPQYDFWTLREKVEKKYRIDNDQWLYAADFMKVQTFKYLPKMIKKLSLVELKKYFVDLATKLGREVVTS